MSNKPIESEKLLVKDLFQRWYRIPEYQRPYVWGSDQVGELVEDIYKARQSNPDAQYFLGSMVLKKSNKQHGSSYYEEYDVLDGQQRLTTLLVLTAVVRDLTPATNAPRLKTCRETIYRIANPDDNIPERDRIVFDIRENVKDFAEQYIKTDGGTLRVHELSMLAENTSQSISIRNMAKAILVIKAFFENGNSIDEFFPYLRSNVLMIYVATEELEDAFHLFTVMNNRGIRLRNSDILKAENLAEIKDVNERMKYAKTWERIEEYFGEEFDNFLSHLRTLLVKQKASYNLLKEYEENIYAPREFDRNSKVYTPKPPLLTKGKSTFNFIEQAHKNYQQLFEDDNFNLTKSFEICNKLILMQLGLEADYWVAPLLGYYGKYKELLLDKFIDYLDRKVSADWIVGLSPTKRVENLNGIIKAIEASDNPDVLLGLPVFTINNEDTQKAFFGNVYGRPYARYLLLKLELIYHGHTTKFAPPATISIEHILPQTPDESSRWLTDFNETDRQRWTNRIGNLILLSRRKNTSQGNLDFGEKKERYFRKNVELFSNSVRIFQQYSSWKLEDMKKNHRETLTKLLIAYGLPAIDIDRQFLN